MEKKLPEGWGWKRLGDVVEILDSQRIPIKEDERKKRNSDKSPSDLIPYYGATGQVGWIDDYIFDEELVLLGEDGVPFFEPAKNKAYIITGKSWVNNHVHVLRAKKSVMLNSFLYRYLNIFNYNGYVAGTTRLKLNKSRMSTIPIPRPPLETQRKIVAILEKAEETKRLRMQADGLTTQLLQSVFLEMFGDPVKNPKRWRTMKLGKIGAVNSGLTLNGQRRGNKSNLFPYLRVANVFRNKLNLEEIKYIHISDSEFERFMLKKNDVLIVEGHGNIEEIGRAAIWKGEIPNCAHQNHLIRVRLDGKYIHSHFLSFFINSYGNHGYFSSKSRTTSGLNTISANKVRDAKVPLPPLALQQKFAQIVDKVEEIRKEMKKSKQETDNLFNALTCKAFTGELIT